MSDATHNPNFSGFRATATDAITNMSHAHGQVLAQRDALLNALQVAVATIERLQRHAPGSANGTLDVARAAIALAGGGSK